MNDGERIAQAIWFSIGAMAVIAFLWWLFPDRWRRFCAWLTEHYLMTRAADEPDDDGDMQTGIYTGMAARPYQPYQPGVVPDQAPTPDRTGADMDALDAGMDSDELPRVGRYLSEDEILVLLAVQRLPDGRYRYSANKLALFAGGDRNTVLATIRAVRETPQYPPRAPEQQRVRERLGLEVER